MPKASPTFSALAGPGRKSTIDEERSYIFPADLPNIEKLKALWKELDDRAEKFFAGANYGRDRIVPRYQVNMRYSGQNFALTFDIKTNVGRQDLSFVEETIGQRAIDLFNKRQMEEYGHVREGEIPEIVGVRLATHVDTPSPPLTAGFTAPKVTAKATKTRLANLGSGFKETNIMAPT